MGDLGRAIPLLVVAYLLLGLNALDLADWTWLGNVLAAVFVVAVLVLTWIGANVIRGRPPLQRPDTIGPVELALLVVVPAVPSAVFGQWGDVVQTVLEGVVVLLAVWALTSYGVLPLLAWAGRRTSSQLPAFLNLIVRALPLLLLFMTFLFVNAEVWEVAGTLTGPIYVVVLAVFFILGNVFLLSRLPALMRAAEHVQQLDGGHRSRRAAGVVPDDFVHDVAGDADGGSRRRPPADAPAVQHRPRRRVLAGDPDHRHGPGDVRVLRPVRVPGDRRRHGRRMDRRPTVHVLVDVTIGGRRLVVTEPLLRVAGFLGAFAGHVLHGRAVDRRDLPRGVRRGHRPRAASGAGGAPAVSAGVGGVMMVRRQRRAGVTDG